MPDEARISVISSPDARVVGWETMPLRVVPSDAHRGRISGQGLSSTLQSRQQFMFCAPDSGTRGDCWTSLSMTSFPFGHQLSAIPGAEQAACPRGKCPSGHAICC